MPDNPTEQTEQTKRLPTWTVLSNLKRHEATPWIGSSIEFFDSEFEAERCFQRHRVAGDTSTKRPFHHSDERDLHVLDTRHQADLVHILVAGLPLCRFSITTPSFWPAGHRWVSEANKDQATCPDCRRLL